MKKINFNIYGRYLTAKSAKVYAKGAIFFARKGARAQSFFRKLYENIIMKMIALAPIEV
ncbi:hypothetical protein [Flavobacterium piscisymbiosum]|uniref:Uncharacterized protein n=1 Tax=Flavobacterium piscisymbiosum TaxID=2893753 RepID=A0ABS8M917_9FLAO|nr:hypothetical protein [Flavobacterium sp. F-30]MCC9061995.1 hypothetical protein [Flavobacterium sp. F-30]